MSDSLDKTDDSVGVPVPLTKISIMEKADGTVIKSTQKSNPDGCITSIVVETTDPEGNKTVEIMEHGGTAPLPEAFPLPSSNLDEGSNGPLPPPDPRDQPIETMEYGGSAPPPESFPLPSSNLDQSSTSSLPSPDLQDQPVEKTFWSRNRKMLAIIALLLVIGLVIALVLVATKSNSKSNSVPVEDSILEDMLRKEGFNFTWDSEMGVVILSSYTSYFITTLELCARQCTTINATSGFFIESNGDEEDSLPLCYCDSYSTCLEPSLDIQGAQVFAQFPMPGPCEMSFCDDVPDDPTCIHYSLTSSTPTTSPTSPSSPPPILKASIYDVEWYGSNDEDEACEQPTPGIRVFCGEGAEINIINTTLSVDCEIVGDREISCTMTGDSNMYASLMYGCIGSSENSWATHVEAVPDTSVPCSQDGEAGTRVYLGRVCPTQEAHDFNKMQCDPSSSLDTDANRNNFCEAHSVCDGSSCDLSTPEVAASIPDSAVSDSCLFAVSNTPTPITTSPSTSPPTSIQTMPSTTTSTPSPSTPSPTTTSSRIPAPTTPPGTILSSVYQVNWGGFVYPEGGCEEPTPGIRVFCGEGAEIEILDNTQTVDCSYDGTVEISCNVTFEENYVWALVYACTGSSVVSWTTNVEVIPGASVECSSGGIAGNAIILMQRCPFQEEPVLDNMQCNPAESVETNQQGDKICMSYSECPFGTCVLSIPPVGGFIPESAISDPCLFRQ